MQVDSLPPELLLLKAWGPELSLPGDVQCRMVAADPVSRASVRALRTLCSAWERFAHGHPRLF